jgi:hypothetical protein
LWLIVAVMERRAAAGADSMVCSVNIAYAPTDKDNLVV